MTKADSGLPVQVSQQLLRRIIAKEFPPGSVLPSEREISETYTVSRPVAREAIKLLVARGLVTVHPRQGATVGQDLAGAAGEALLLAFHQADAVQEEVLQLRLLLEPQVAGLAARHGSLVQQRKLGAQRQLIQQLCAALEAQDHERATVLWPQTDQPLHTLLGEMSQNVVFTIVVNILNTVIWTNTQDGVPALSVENMTVAAQHHLTICDAVLGGEAAAAEAAMRTHLEYTYDYIMRAHNQQHEPLYLNLT